MKSLFFVVLIFTFSSSVFAETTESTPSTWDSMCGFTDDIYSYITENSHAPTETKLMISGKQGETGRMIRILKTGEWLVTFEFYNIGPVEGDVSCIIGSGKREDISAYELTTALIGKLPEVKYKEFGKNPKDYEPLKDFKILPIPKPKPQPRPVDPSLRWT
jgi:hypothetical protein